MDTPIWDFVQRYERADRIRFHMPGHKGRGFLGCERLDITEVKGADSLYEAEGIIAQSEANATALFGAQRTCYSTEGSSQCIRAMLYLALTQRPKGASNIIVAARNVHKAFVHAAALLDFEVVWLWPEQSVSLCGCPVSPAYLERTLSEMEQIPAAVYLTSPDYLGGVADIAALAEVCHRNGTILAVDNAHGAYLHFLKVSQHPLDLGADLCCDSAHKTLPVLTGGAYLHISRRLPNKFAECAKSALALFGSTSPSYLTMASLDLCNRYLSQEYSERLWDMVCDLERLRSRLRESGWQIEESDPLRVTICAPEGSSGMELAEQLRVGGIECEYADDAYVVLMLTPENTGEELEQLSSQLGTNTQPKRIKSCLPVARGERVCSIRQALFAAHRTVPVEQAFGRVCGTPTVSCPPAIPIAVSGERIGAETLELLRHYQVPYVDVLDTIR